MIKIGALLPDYTSHHIRHCYDNLRPHLVCSSLSWRFIFVISIIPTWTYSTKNDLSHTCWVSCKTTMFSHETWHCTLIWWMVMKICWVHL